MTEKDSQAILHESESREKRVEILVNQNRLEELSEIVRLREKQITRLHQQIASLRQRHLVYIYILL